MTKIIINNNNKIIELYFLKKTLIEMVKFQLMVVLQV